MRHVYELVFKVHCIPRSVFNNSTVFRRSNTQRLCVLQYIEFVEKPKEHSCYFCNLCFDASIKVISKEAFSITLLWALLTWTSVNIIYNLVIMKPFTLFYFSSFALVFSKSVENTHHSQHKRSGIDISKQQVWKI